MKDLTYTVLILLLAFLTISGCTKISDPANNGKIVASKTEVKINEPDSLVLVGASATDSVHWSVAPAGFNILTSSNNVSRIVFNKSGNYTVSATKPGALPASISIKVSTDSVVTTPDTAKIVQLTGDQLTMSPGIYFNAKGDSLGFDFNVTTANRYCASGLLKYNQSVDANNNFNIDFLYVQEPKVCKSTNDIPMVVSPLRFYQKYEVNGTYPLKVTLNGKVYTGSIVITPAQVIFNWNYTSGVLIPFKTYNRSSNTFLH
jgi:hypothetical protein